MQKLDIEYVRDQFPALSNGFTFFDNAGGSQVVKHVGNKINDYLFSSNVQLGASYEISVESGKKIYEAHKLWAEAIGAEHPEEIVFGSSATALIQNIARSLSSSLSPGDEIIVSNSDHEANIGPWVNLASYGVTVKFWNINPESLKLELNDLEKIISEKTKLVAFTHVSNILGTINPVADITYFVHSYGAKVFVDGVAYAPHRNIDIRKWDVDYYVFSLYKVYGPHYSILYGKKEHLDKLESINHFFITNDDIPYKLQPGNVNFELTYGSTGILDYYNDAFNFHFDNEQVSSHNKFDSLFQLIAQHEEDIFEPLINFLNNKKGISVIGEHSANKDIRVPTISFTVDNKRSSEIPLLVDPYKIGIRWGDFYARRLIDFLGFSGNDGIVRVSMVHYNSVSEVDNLIRVIDEVL